MKYFGLAAAALVMTISASATQVATMCGTFDAPGGGTSGSWTCPTFASLDGGGTVTDAMIVYESDYSSGLGSSQDTQTIFGFSGNTSLVLSDTVTSTGGSSSNQPVSGDGLPFNATATPVLAGFYNTLSTFSAAEVVTFNNSVISGSVLSTTGYAQLVFDYTPATGAPEPGSMMLLGGGLLAAGLIGRKKLVRK